MSKHIHSQIHTKTNTNPAWGQNQIKPMSRGRQISSKANVSRLNNSLKVYVHTRIHDRIHTFTHTCARSYICIHTYIHAYISIHACIHSYIHMHSFMYTFIYSYMHAYSHTYIHVHIYVLIKNADTNDEIEPSPDERRNAQANLLGQNREGTIFDSKTGQPISHDRIQGPQDDMCYKEASR